MDPPDSIPNSEVKRCNADGSVGFPHVRVGHRQVIKYKSEFNYLKKIEITEGHEINFKKNKNPSLSTGVFFFISSLFNL